MDRKLTLILVIGIAAGGIYGMHLLGVEPVDAAFDFMTNPPLAIVGSGSMAPTLERGDVVHLEDVNPRAIEEGDVAAFSITPAKQAMYNYPPTIVHRVVEVKERDGRLYFKTAGDRSGKDPFEIVEYNVRGKYTGFKVPRVGLVLLFLQTSRGQMYVLFSAILLLSMKFVPDFWEGWREREEMRQSMHEGIKSIRESVEGGARAASDIVLRRGGRGEAEAGGQGETPEAETPRRGIVLKRNGEGGATIASLTDRQEGMSGG